MYRLVISTEFTHLFEFPDGADLREFHAQYPYKAGFVVTSVSGCDARKMVGSGIEHSTGLHRWPNGTAHRTKPPTTSDVLR